VTVTSGVTFASSNPINGNELQTSSEQSGWVSTLSVSQNGYFDQININYMSEIGIIAKVTKGSGPNADFYGSFQMHVRTIGQYYSIEGYDGFGNHLILTRYRDDHGIGSYDFGGGPGSALSVPFTTRVLRDSRAPQISP
jgi:hypothetical protein